MNYKQLINSLSADNVISSFNFAKNCNLIFSEIISNEQFNKFNQNDIFILHEDTKDIFYKNNTLKLSENKTIFCNYYLVEDLFNILREVTEFKNIKIVVMQSDHSIGSRIASKIPDCVSGIYAVNILVNHPKLFPIPIGLANYYSQKNLSFSDFKNINNFLVQKKIKKLYVNFEENTNFFHRYPLLKKLEKLDFVYIEKKKLTLEEYSKKLSLYKYIFCPYGNGVDTHRIWETLYSGSTPVVFNHKTFETLKNLPVIFLDNFSNLSIKFLEKENEKIKNSEFQKLLLDYWIKYIEGHNFQNESIEIELDTRKFNIEILKNYNNKKKKENIKKQYSTYLRKIYKKFF